MTEFGSYSTLVVAIVVSIVCLAAGVLISWLFRPMNPTPVKLEPYECGEPVVGSAEVPFRSLFYLVGIAFLIFDVEAVFLFPWAVAFRGLGWFAFIEMVVFVAILLVGLAYAWKKGALRWQ